MTGLRGEPTVAERPAQPYVGVRRSVTTATIAQVADRIGELVGWLAERGQPVAGAPFLRYHAIGTAATLDVEAGVPVAAPVGGDGDVHDASLPAGRYVSYRHMGHPDQLEAVTGEVLDWAAQRDLKMDAEGDRWGCRLEVFYSNPAEVPDPNDWETELVLRLANEEDK